MRKCALILSFLMACMAIRPGLSPASAQQPASLAISAGGWDGIGVAIPYGQSTRIRVEGRNTFGQKVTLDPTKVVWTTRGKQFSYEASGDTIEVRPLIDAFGLGKPRDQKHEPSTMLRATYGSAQITFQVSSVLSLKGKWMLTVTGDKVNLDLTQSGREIKDSKGGTGRVAGRVLSLSMTFSAYGLPIPLSPVVMFTSSTTGHGYVDVPSLQGSKRETFIVVKQP